MIEMEIRKPSFTKKEEVIFMDIEEVLGGKDIDNEVIEENEETKDE